MTDPRYTNPWGLTVQEYRVLERLNQCDGISKRVAVDMGMAVRTVDKHVMNACKKMGTRNRYAAAMKFYIELGQRHRPGDRVALCQACAGLGFTTARSAA